MSTHASTHAAFERDLSSARTPGAAYAALCDLTQALVGARLFTIMTVDMSSELAQRAFTNDPANYPASGTKPVQRNSWFSVVHDRHECFVSNTIDEIAGVFPDHQLIASLGCGSVMNLPVVIGGELVATVNILHEEHHFSPERVVLVKEHLTLPSLATLSVAQLLT